MMIPTGQDIKTVTDLRENTISLLNSIQKKKDPVIIMHRNSPKVVILSVKKYNQLMDMLEDHLDEKLAIELEKEAKKANREDYIPQEEVEKELGINV